MGRDPSLTLSPMTLLTLLSLLWSFGLEGVIPQPVELDVMTVAQAWANNGRLVVTSFTIKNHVET